MSQDISFYYTNVITALKCAAWSEAQAQTYFGVRDQVRTQVSQFPAVSEAAAFCREEMEKSL